MSETARPGEFPGPALRDRILRTRPEELGFVADSDFPSVYGVVVDWPLDVEVASILVGSPRPSAQNGASIKWAPMSPRAPAPKSVQPRQLNGW